MPLRGPRPAIRIDAGTGPLVLSFDTDADRDRAAAELLDDAGLGPDGRRPCAAEGERDERLRNSFDLVDAQGAAGPRYHEFLRVPDLSAGIYVLEAGATDLQSPHTEDELYYVVAGRGVVTVGGDAPRRPRHGGLRRRDRPASLSRHR